jgi:hypothetical protein
MLKQIKAMENYICWCGLIFNMIAVRRSPHRNTRKFAYVLNHSATHGGSFDVKLKKLLVQIPMDLHPSMTMILIIFLHFAEDLCDATKEKNSFPKNNLLNK